MRYSFLFMLMSVLLFDQHDIFAQDTFYVKKKNRPVVAAPMRMAAWDTTNKDSIASYTVEYPAKTGNIWVKAHMKGPWLHVPSDRPKGQRVLFTEIIAMDSTGRKYRQPDRFYVSGIWVPVKAPANK